jgi:hypothetical protein
LLLLNLQVCTSQVVSFIFVLYIYIHAASFMFIPHAYEIHIFRLVIIGYTLQGRTVCVVYLIRAESGPKPHEHNCTGLSPRADKPF